MTQERPRSFSYGQHRQFNVLERAAIQRRVREVLKTLRAFVANRPSEPIDVLELGCGYFASNLQQIKRLIPNARCTGVDLVVSQEVANRQELELLEVELDSWRPPRTFDLVLSLAVIEHLVDIQRHFDLIARSLRPNGIAVNTTPTPYAHFMLQALGKFGIVDTKEIIDHKLYLTRTGVYSLARRASLEVLDYNLFQFGMNQHYVLQLKAKGD